MIFEKYNDNLSYSYIFGAFGTITLLEKRKEECIAILIDPSFTNNEAFIKIKELCKNTNIEIIIDKKVISKIRDKGNIFVIGVFKKYDQILSNNKHLVLYKINDEGCIGTIIRSMRGFDFENLVLIDCDIDLYHEHLIRSTMGAFFSCNIKEYSTLDKYLLDYKDNNLICISTKGEELNKIKASDNLSIILSNQSLNINKATNYKFDQNIPLENIANIVLFNLYN